MNFIVVDFFIRRITSIMIYPFVLIILILFEAFLILIAIWNDYPKRYYHVAVAYVPLYLIDLLLFGLLLYFAIKNRGNLDTKMGIVGTVFVVMLTQAMMSLEEYLLSFVWMFQIFPLLFTYSLICILAASY
jgi:hypothetical protein